MGEAGRRPRAESKAVSGEAGVSRVSSLRVDFSPPDDGRRLVRASALHQFDALVIELKGNPKTILNAAGLGHQILHTPAAVVPYSQFAKVLERAAAHLGYRDFGLRLALYQAARSSSDAPVAAVLRNAPTMRVGLEALCDRANMYFAYASLDLQRDPSLGADVLRFVNSGLHRAPPRQSIEHSLLRLHLEANAATGLRSAASEVWLASKPRLSSSCYERYFGCTVRFHKPFDALWFSPGVLDACLPMRDHALYETAFEILRTQLPPGATPLTNQIRYLISARGAKHSGCDRIASALRIVPRTLQRRLKDEGTTFEQIKEEYRRVNAVELLQRSDLDICDVAKSLGYTQRTAFARSCKRWFGVSPTELRRQGRALQPQPTAISGTHDV